MQGPAPSPAPSKTSTGIGGNDSFEAAARRLAASLAAINAESAAESEKSQDAVTGDLSGIDLQQSFKEAAKQMKMLAWWCLSLSFYIGLTKHEVLEMLSQVHRDLENFRWSTKQGSMNCHTRWWTGPKNSPVLQWSDRQVINANGFMETGVPGN